MTMVYHLLPAGLPAEENLSTYVAGAASCRVIAWTLEHSTVRGTPPSASPLAAWSAWKCCSAWYECGTMHSLWSLANVACKTNKEHVKNIKHMN